MYDAVRALLPAISRQFVAYALPFTAFNTSTVAEFTGSAEVPDVLGGLWPAGSWQNGPTWWYPLTGQIPYHETSFGTATIPGALGFRVTRRIRVTRIKGRIYLRLGSADCAVRLVVGQFKKPALAWTVGGPGFFPGWSTGTAFYGVPGTNWSNQTPPIFCGINNAWYASTTPGAKATYGTGAAGWPVVYAPAAGNMNPDDADFAPQLIPGPFNTVLTYSDGQTAPANHQYQDNTWWGQQYTFMGGAGRDFRVKFAATANTLNALADQDADAGGNKMYQVIEFDIDCSDCPETVYEEYVDFEAIGAMNNTSVTLTGGTNERYGNFGIPTENPLGTSFDNQTFLPYGEVAEAVDDLPIKNTEDSGFWTDTMYKNHFFMGFCSMRAGTIQRAYSVEPWLNWGGNVVVDYDSVYDQASTVVSFDRGMGGLNTRS